MFLSHLRKLSFAIVFDVWGDLTVRISPTARIFKIEINKIHRDWKAQKNKTCEMTSLVMIVDISYWVQVAALPVSILSISLQL